tara:strand:+ start:68 stop:1897 length:1830 start_codon:yes stop_codon:yes gene_type:complete
MSNNNVTIELKQQNAINVRSNGDWSNSISENIAINEGDSLLISKTFIDTTSQSDSKIIIPNDIKVEVDFCRYFTSIIHNSPTAPTQAVENKVYTGNDFEGRTPAATYFQDGLDYIQNQQTSSGNYGPNVRLITELQIHSEKTSQVQTVMGSATDPQVPVSFTYIAPDGKTRLQYSMIVDPKSIPSIGKTTRKVAVRFYCDVTKPFIAVNGNNRKGLEGTGIWNGQYGQNLDPYRIDVIGSTDNIPISEVLSPHIQVISTIIPKGEYTSTALVGLLNNSFQNNYIDGSVATTTIPVNPLLRSSNLSTLGEDDIWVNQNSHGGATVALTKLAFCKQINGTINPWWHGSSLCNLNFNPSTNTFFWQYLHMPYYDITGNIIAEFQENTSTSDIFFAGKNSGIVLTGLFATNNDPSLSNYQEIYDFWGGNLGFDVPSITSSFVLTENPVSLASNYIFHEIVNYGNSISTTTGRPVLDGMIGKSATHHPFIVPPITSFSETIDLTLEIYAKNSVLNPLQLDYGYFLIEIQGGFKTKMISSTEITHNISAIVNRYYSLGSYTSSSSDASLIYTHSGAPLYLNSFNIRILDSSRNQALNLDDDNTVYLQIIRAETQP